MLESVLSWLKGNCLFVEAANGDPIMVSGPGVKMLYETIMNMFGLGAPIVYNDIGFNKGDWTYFQSSRHLLNPDEMPLGFVVPAVHTLMKYKNRQLPQWAELKRLVQIDVDTAKKKAGFQQGQRPVATGDKKVKNLGQGSYGKTKFLIPELERKVELAIKRMIKEVMQQDRMKYPPQVNKFSGNEEPPLFRGLTKDKTGFDQWEIHRDFIHPVSEILKNAGYDISEMTQQAEAPAGSAGGTPTTKLVHVTDTGENVSLAFDYSETIVGVIKELFPQRTWNKETKKWVLFSPTKAGLQSLADSFEQEGFDTSELQKVIESRKDTPPPSAKTGVPIQVVDITGVSTYQVAVRVTRNKELNEKIKDAVRYTFPVYAMPEEENPMRNYDKASYQWQLKGKRSQYFQLYKVLKINGFEVSQLIDVVKKLIAEQKIEADRVPGRLEGYEERYGVNDVQKFDKDLDGMVKKTLYDKQKDGVRFLYGNTSAVLGDETGAGKTFQLVAGAAMRMKNDGGRTLIVTLPSTLRQWMQEIAKLTGEDPKNISNDPNSGARWVVLYYHQFANPHPVKTIQAQGTPLNIQQTKPMKSRDKLVQDILRSGFTCLILDECHNVKNDNITTENVAKIAGGIPFKWGATATFIANKAIDAYNQLKILGHPLGQLSLGRFKREFGGMVPEGYRGAYVDGPPEVQEAAAANLRKWMTQMGAYIKRTKRDINPDLPNHTVENLPVDIDMASFNRKVQKRMSTYRDKNLAISEMIAQRVEAAIAKVPFTLDMAKNVLMQDKKVLVFTCFIEPASALKDGLEKIINSKDVGGGTVEIVVGSADKDEIAAAVARFKDPKGSSKAMVLSILKGGTGIDLPNVVEDVLINDFSWTPKDAEQSEGRAFRISSTSDVTTTYIVADNSPDKKMYDYVQKKKEIATKIQNLEKEEMAYVLKGLSTTELQKKRQQLLEESRRLDAENQMASM